MYCRIQIQTPRRSSCSATWSQQKPPAADGRVVNGSTKVHEAPPSVDRLAYQFPVTKMRSPATPSDGSPTVDVASSVATSSSCRLSTSVIAHMAPPRFALLLWIRRLLGGLGGARCGTPVPDIRQRRPHRPALLTDPPLSLVEVPALLLLRAARRPFGGGLRLTQLDPRHLVLTCGLLAHIVPPITSSPAAG